MTEDNKALSQVLCDLYVDACRELFSAYGLSVRLGDRPADGLDDCKASYISLLGMTGHDISLLSVLTVDDHLLSGSHPIGSSEDKQPELADWCRELCNQLGGRFKNKLLMAGCEVQLGLATLISGENITLSTDTKADTAEFFVTTAEGDALARLSMRFAPGYRLSPSTVAEGVTNLEGTHLLF